MAKPIFKAMSVAPHNSTHLPRTLQTALFVHRMKGVVAKPKSQAHPVIHQPIIVRPARPSHTNATSNLPLY